MQANDSKKQIFTDEERISVRLRGEVLKDLARESQRMGGEGSTKTVEIYLGEPHEKSAVAIKEALLESLKKDGAITGFKLISKKTRLDVHIKKHGKLAIGENPELRYEDVPEFFPDEADTIYAKVQLVQLEFGRYLDRKRGCGGKIESIVFVRKEGLDSWVVLNDEYKNPLRINAKKYWRLLRDIAERRAVPAEENKGMLDYFNSNAKNPIYARRGYALTKVLRFANGSIEPEIRLGVISGETLKQKQRNLKKKAPLKKT